MAKADRERTMAMEKVTSTENPGQGPTARFGAWASGLDFEAISREVIEHAKLCLLDGLG